MNDMNTNTKNPTGTLGAHWHVAFLVARLLGRLEKPTELPTIREKIAEELTPGLAELITPEEMATFGSDHGTLVDLRDGDRQDERLIVWFPGIPRNIRERILTTLDRLNAKGGGGYYTTRQIMRALGGGTTINAENIKICLRELVAAGLVSEGTYQDRANRTRVCYWKVGATPELEQDTEHPSHRAPSSQPPIPAETGEPDSEAEPW